MGAVGHLYNNANGFFGGANVPFTANIPGQPHFVLVQGLRQNQLSRGGVIFNNTPNATIAQQFNAAGTGLTNFAIGQQGFRAIGGQVVGGDGDPAYTNLTLQPNVERKTSFSHLEYEFNDSVTGYAELSYGQVQGVNNQWESGQNQSNVCIRPDNGYLAGLSAGVRSAVTGLDGNSAFVNDNNVVCSGLFAAIGPGIGILNAVPGTVISKNWQGQNLETVTTDTKVTRGVLGANGKLILVENSGAEAIWRRPDGLQPKT